MILYAERFYKATGVCRVGYGLDPDFCNCEMGRIAEYLRNRATAEGEIAVENFQGQQIRATFPRATGDGGVTAVIKEGLNSRELGELARLTASNKRF